MADLPEPRVSDAERDLVVDQLRSACAEGRLTLEEFSDRVGDAYRARTSTDLDRLTGDLPAQPGPDPPEVPETHRITSILGGANRTGPWRPANPTRVTAVIGSCQVDLTEVDLEPVTELVVTVVCGGVEVLVPEGVRVDLGGFAFLGGRDDRTSAARRDGPVVRIRCRVVLGGVTARTRPFRR